MPGQRQDRWVRLALDLWSAKILAWVASVGRDAELSSDAHFYFADRYQRLSRVHRTHRRLARAERLEQRAQYHLDAGGWHGPPHAVAMALPRPVRLTFTNAVSSQRLGGGDDAA